MHEAGIEWQGIGMDNKISLAALPVPSDSLAPPRQEPYGRVAVFVDPFGNRWDLIQPAP